jgi:2-polyprenyl-3-methyl-5-hydroxy-6-metoxy-1,4-benzoquinol methylase
MDIGCGHGTSFRMLNKMKCDATYYGMEGGANYQQDLSELNVNIIDWSSDTLNIDDKYNDFFDLILMSHVLEHFNALYLESILKNINKYLKSGGIFICEVPNDNSSYQLLESVNQAPHLTFFSQKSLIKIMKDCGFDIKYAQCVGRPVNTNINNNKLNPLRIKLKKYTHRYSAIKKMYHLLRQIFTHILILKKYHLSNDATTVINSQDFIYGDDRGCIRICGIKK